MKRLIVGLTLAAGLAGTASAQAIGGTYSVGGKNFDGSAYSGIAQITPAGSTCRIVWNVGGASSQGVCMISNKAFAAFYKLGSNYGLVVYELQPDGSLKGQWTIAGKEGIGSETLVPKIR